MTSISIGTSGGLLALSALTPATIAGVATLLGIGALLHGNSHQQPSYGHKYPMVLKPIDSKGVHEYHPKHHGAKQPQKVISHDKTYHRPQTSSGVGHLNKHSPNTKGRNVAHSVSSTHFPEYGGTNKGTNGESTGNENIPVYTSKFSGTVYGDHANNGYPSGFGAPKPETIQHHRSQGKQRDYAKNRAAGLTNKQSQSSPPDRESIANMKPKHGKFPSPRVPNASVRQQNYTNMNSKLRSHFQELQLSRNRKSFELHHFGNGGTETIVAVLLENAARIDTSDCAKRMICEISAQPPSYRSEEQEAMLRVIRKFSKFEELGTTGAMRHFGAALRTSSVDPTLCQIRYSKCQISRKITVLRAYELMKD